MTARINMRDHFKQLGLVKAIRELRKTQANRSELIMQITVFEKEMKFDEDKVMEKLLDGKVETYPFIAPFLLLKCNLLSLILFYRSICYLEERY